MMLTAAVLNRFLAGNMLSGNIPESILKDGFSVYVIYLDAAVCAFPAWVNMM